MYLLDSFTIFYFYPRPPRGGRLACAHKALQQLEFLSTPSARRATLLFRMCLAFCIFLSTPSARRATRKASRLPFRWRISIHALREEGDPARCCHVLQLRNFYPRPPRGGRPRRHEIPGGAAYFYPRPPRGGRPVLCGSYSSRSLFLSTPSARRATCDCSF